MIRVSFRGWGKAPSRSPYDTSNCHVLCKVLYSLLEYLTRLSSFICTAPPIAKTHALVSEVQFPQVHARQQAAPMGSLHAAS